MGADYAIDLTASIRRILNIIAILEANKETSLSSREIKQELNNYETVDESDSKIIPRFKKHILEWKNDYGLRLIKGVNGDRINHRSPFKFNLDKNEPFAREAYKELLTITFSLLLIRNGEYNFLDNFLELENPLSTLTVILDSVKYKGNPQPFLIEYKENDNIIEQKVYYKKIKNTENGS